MAFGTDTDPGVGVATQFTPGQSGNPNGLPKGYRRISTWVKDLLADETFKAKVKIGEDVIEFEGAPFEAIVKAQIAMAITGDTRATDLLMKYAALDEIKGVIPPDGSAKTIIETRKRINAAQIVEGELVDDKGDDFGMDPDEDRPTDPDGDITDGETESAVPQNPVVIRRRHTTDEIKTIEPIDD